MTLCPATKAQCICQPDEGTYCPDSELVAAGQRIAEPLRQILERENAALLAKLAVAEADTTRLRYLINNAYYYGPAVVPDLVEPDATCLVIGSRVDWPDGVRAAIDAACAGAQKEGA